MVTLSDIIWALLWVAILASMGLPLLSATARQQLRLKMAPSNLKFPGLLMLPFLILFGLGEFLHIQSISALPYFIGAFALGWLLSHMQLPILARGSLLLLIAVVLSLGLPAETASQWALLGVILGLSVWKSAELLALNGDWDWTDLMMPLLWIVGVYWLDVQGMDQAKLVLYGVLAGLLAVSLLLRQLAVVSFKLPAEWLLKPVLLAILGGLAVLILIQNVLLAPHLTDWAWLYAGGILLGFLLAGLTPHDHSENTVSSLLSAVLLIGLGTLVASRLYGSMGWLVLASAVLVLDKPGLAKTAALFWILRTLLQTFIFQYNPNVTGINIQHPYASAALYGGILLILLLPVILQSLKNRGQLLTGFLVLGTLVPILSNYLLHAEPTGSLFVTATITALLVTVMGTLLYRQSDTTLQDCLLVFVLQLLSVGLLSAPLIEQGNLALRAEKLAFLAILFGMVAVLAVLAYRLRLLGPSVKIPTQ